MKHINYDMSLHDIKVEYYKHITSLMVGLKEKFGDYVDTELIYEAANSSEWVESNYLNRFVYIISDNGYAIEDILEQDEIGGLAYNGGLEDMDKLDATRAYFAIVADLTKQLEDME